MSTIFYKLYQPCGLFNQLSSLELAVGLSGKYKKKLVLHRINNTFDNNYNSRVPVYSANYAFNDRKGLVDTGIFPKITDLVDWKEKESAILLDDVMDISSNNDYFVSDLMRYYISDSENTSEDEESFSEGRTKLSLSQYQNIYIDKTLGYYSRFFYNRDKEIDKCLNSVKFKKEYYELAKQIAESLGNFNGAHFRLTDMTTYFNPGTNDLDQGLSRLNGNLPIVMCTDEPNNKIFQNSSYKYLFLDSYILDNFYKEFRELEFKEEVSFGILNNLVMHYSKDFIGSPASTFTGYIYRAINQKNDTNLKLFTEEEHEKKGPYSWNGYTIKDTYTKQWWREWNESKLYL